MSAHTAALRKSLAAMKRINYKDCADDESVWHDVQEAIAEAERLLRDGEKQEPVAYMQRRVRVWKSPDAWDYATKWEPTPKEWAENNMENMRRGLHLEGEFEVIPLYTHPAPSLQAVGAVPEDLLKNPQLLRIVQRMDEANRADDFGKRARKAFEELCEWIASLAAPQPAAAPSGDVERDMFLHGVIAALGALAPHHQHGDVVHDEIVSSVGKEALYRAAEPEDIAWAALDPEYYAAITATKEQP